jgi:hypothetical protein
VRSFMDDVREGMAEREQQIHEAIEAGVHFEDELDDDVDDEELFTRRGNR